MSDDKDINVRIKYSQEGSDEIAKGTGEITKRIQQSLGVNGDIAQSAKQGALQLKKEYINALQEIEKYSQSRMAQLVDSNANASQWNAFGENVNEMKSGLDENYSSQMKIFNLQKQIESESANIANENKKALDPTQPKQFEQSLRGVGSEYRRMRENMEGISVLGRQIMVVGIGMTGGVFAAAQNYINSVAGLSQVSSEWLVAQKEIKSATSDIGEVAAEVLLPAMKSSAEFVREISAMVKENPWLLQAGLYVGVAMTAIGGAISLTATLVRAYASVGLVISQIQTSQIKQAALMAKQEELLAESMLQRAMGQNVSILGPVSSVSGAAFASITVGSLIVGSIVGVGVGNWLGKILDEMGLKAFKDYKNQNFQDAIMTFVKLTQLPLAVYAQGLEKMGGNFKKTGDIILDWLNNIDSTAGKLIGASRYQNPSDDISNSSASNPTGLTEYIAYQKQVNNAQSKYSTDRLDIIKNYEQQIADTTAQYESQRASIIKSYEDAVTKAAQNYAQASQKALTNHHDAVAKAEATFKESQKKSAQQHAIDLQKIERDHNSRVYDLAAARDALGLVKENQRYNEEKNASSQSYKTQQAEAKRNYQTQIADLNNAFNQQRADAKAAYEQQLADAKAQEKQQLTQLDAAHKTEMAKLDAQEKEKLQKLDEAYKKETETLYSAFIDRLKALDKTILGTTQAMINEAARQLEGFNDFIAKYKAQNPVSVTPLSRGGRRTGGYATFSGADEDGLPEFVMSNSTTRAAESLIGGGLSQTSLLSSIMKGRNSEINKGSQGLTINVNSKNLSIKEIRNEIASALDQKIGDLLPNFG